ncbi:MAG: PAS domain-containing protein [Actinomycetota bacterium]|nr:PAS domain-containing protein [Actinomycetota bacterium]
MSTRGGARPRPGDGVRLGLLRSILENANDAVLVTEGGPIDEPGPRVVYTDAAFSRTTGYSYEEIVGRSPRVLQGPGTDRAKLDEVRTALETGGSVRTELLNYRNDGTPFWVELDIVPVFGEDGG